ncbi:DUF2285 domain-containing protein [Ralstonia pseudosolanacearum]|uniref:DUF2285 domain-containing protein n=1 Tax=Ralstonia pseudosolanacearum TaxID=1310165 RepID=UPI0002DA0BC8|nr:DUF2285 domain-containing protein [Ralstonia pseudosolanacearum]ARS55728.1 hypothetical protein BC427_06160 [Ralstonia solanacearum FJAT-91]QKZ28304.1 DUF2285 domain-containing protein [Ralstonia solanacearum]MCK4150150.1 DUF2285 domain-containing protein [Ralstonia pseudosolanacearum]QKZ33271.1 DUF2285 domain-containing protein [Ralstonia solanacearum]QMT09558.1 DUF2285 domain-containing protein [Ralstonia solanacearum]
MTDRSIEPWYPTAAYLYVLHLDDLALAWEYLRRHPDYQRDWLNRRRRPESAHAWGLRMLEDPALDARDAHPAWLAGHPCIVQLHPDIDPLPDAVAFEFWRIPGHKHLIHDGQRLMLAVHWPGCCLRMTLAPDLEDGMAYVYGMRSCATPCARHCLLRTELDKLSVDAKSTPAAAVRPRPAPTALQELHTLQALDAMLAGASLREIAEGLFGTEAVVEGWYADGGLRSRVRRLVRRGQGLMRGGYRRLAQLQ